jgi:hypothetical protein
MCMPIVDTHQESIDVQSVIHLTSEPLILYFDYHDGIKPDVFSSSLLFKTNI